jgi:hypothetical protein
VVTEAARALGDMKLLIIFPLIPFAIVCGYFVFWIAETLYIFTVGMYHHHSPVLSLLLVTISLII